jgi:hypothetical protein
VNDSSFIPLQYATVNESSLPYIDNAADTGVEGPLEMTDIGRIIETNQVYFLSTNRIFRLAFEGAKTATGIFRMVHQHFRSKSRHQAY